MHLDTAAAVVVAVCAVLTILAGLLAVYIAITNKQTHLETMMVGNAALTATAHEALTARVESVGQDARAARNRADEVHSLLTQHLMQDARA